GRVAGGIADNSSASEDTDDIMEKRVDEVMRDIFPTVGRDTRMPTLSSLLKTEPAVLVLEKGKLVGIITSYDLMENAYKKSPGVIK
ncbi:MAG: CBS domain-containing protein, partial [Nitrososphaera sp.]